MSCSDREGAKCSDAGMKRLPNSRAVRHKRVWPALDDMITTMFHYLGLAYNALFRRAARHGRNRNEADGIGQAEQLLHALFTHSVDALYILSIDRDRTPRFVTWNDVAARAIGQPPEAGTGKTLDEVLSPGIAKQAGEEIAQVVSERRALRFVQRQEGPRKPRTLDVMHIPLLGPDGEVQRIFVSLRDVTHFERVERELQEKTSLLEATLDQMDQGLIVIDDNRRIPIANRRALELLGLSNERMSSSPSYDELIRDRIAANQLAILPDEVLSFIDGGPPDRNPHVRERARPNGRTLEIRTVPFGERGAIRTFTDITERRLAEAARAQSEIQYRKLAERLNLAVDVTGLGTWDTDIRSSERYWSREMRSILGLAPDHDIGEETFLACVHPDDREWVAKRFYENIADAPDEGYRAEFRIIRDDDATERWVALYGKRFLDEQRRPVRTVGTIQDITERRRQAIELEISKEAAEQASQAKTEFLARMSHEIRTPLNGILGYTDIMLTDGTLTVEQRHQLGRIQTAGSALLTIVNDILDFSRIEAGHIALQSHPFALKKLIDDAVGIVHQAAQQKRLGLSISFDGDLPENVLGDEDRLRQVLLNLLNNAIKFTNRGQVTLEVKGRTHSEAKANLLFSVADTGIGIAPDKMGVLFQQFSQADGSIRRQFGGTGLGLAISKQLVSVMGGEIGLRSELGTGSTFWFEVTLPVANVRLQQSAAPGKILGSRPLRVLLAEDNDINQELGKAVLEAAGHIVEIAADGSQAVGMVQVGSYDLVLMDVQMPIMDGVTATRIIRGLDHTACTVPIIAMTANVLPQQVEAFKNAGMDAHIGKPFKLEQLLATIDRVVDGR
jgi:PAS domain S-box-containing protein